MRGRVQKMNLVAEATNIHGLIAYLVEMILIGSAVMSADYIDDQRTSRDQAPNDSWHVTETYSSSITSHGGQSRRVILN
jgi:hypothetical protein